jgi:hypothetical protein
MAVWRKGIDEYKTMSTARKMEIEERLVQFGRTHSQGDVIGSNPISFMQVSNPAAATRTSIRVLNNF